MDLNRETDVNILKDLCKQLLQARDAERAAKLEFERQVTRLQTDVDQICKFYPCFVLSPFQDCCPKSDVGSCLHDLEFE